MLYRWRIAIISSFAVLWGGLAAAGGAPSASILIFPRIVADDGADTLVQLTSAANRVVYLRCSYVGGGGDAVTGPFVLQLAGRQPTHWVASRGRPTDPDDPPCSRQTGNDCDGVGLDPGAIPAAPPSFHGALVCVELDRSGAPLSGNSLHGRATIQTADGDVDAYDALGLRGLASNDGDDVLCVDGIATDACGAAEYSGCPTEARLLHAADGAPDAATQRVVRGAVTAVPCGLALGGAATALQLDVATTDELGQTLSATAALPSLATTGLADLSAVLGAAAGGDVRQTHLSAHDGAGFALVAESERRRADDSGGGGRTASTGSTGTAIVTLPYLLAHAARAVDTEVRLANLSDQPARAHCVYEKTTPTCNDDGASPDACLPGGSGCAQPCLPNHAVTAFDVALAPAQALAWRVGAGLSQAATDRVAAVEVPAMGEAFLGLLRCIAVDALGDPADDNALAATATVETFVAGATAAEDVVDAVEYDGIGQAAVGGAVDGDRYLALGGTAPEYAACSDALVLPNVFDGAIVRLGDRRDTVLTTVALAPCAAELDGAERAREVAQFLVYNEYRQRFSTSRDFGAQLVRQLSLIDSDVPDRSIFSAGVTGTLTGQTRIVGASGGLVGVAIQQHAAVDGGATHGAAVVLQPEGASQRFDLVALGAPACVGDCDASGMVTIAELLRGVNIGLGALPVGDCAALDSSGDGAVTVDEIVRGVTSALVGCPEAGERPTPPPTPTPRPTPAPQSAGPEVSYFGLVSGDDQPLTPVATDDQGRPVYEWPHGAGFGIVVEGRGGTSRRPIGQSAFVAGATALPDFQMIADRDLGDGSIALCDAVPPHSGGVPATVPFAFDAPNALATINDLGCRVDDGVGEPMGALNRGACTRLVNDRYLAPDSANRFCLPVDRAWSFPSGDTTLAVRLRDASGNVGPASEIVVRIP